MVDWRLFFCCIKYSIVLEERDHLCFFVSVYEFFLGYFVYFCLQRKNVRTGFRFFGVIKDDTVRVFLLRYNNSSSCSVTYPLPVCTHMALWTTLKRVLNDKIVTFLMSLMQTFFFLSPRSAPRHIIYNALVEVSVTVMRAQMSCACKKLPPSVAFLAVDGLISKKQARKTSRGGWGGEECGEGGV